MLDKPVEYLGQLISKENFRAYIYAANDIKKLVESWEEFELYIESGMWFASKEEIKGVKDDKPKRIQKAKTKG